ncbi:MAG: hypothetical protein QOH79_2763 [Acidimicrobiaceae bacterium]
MASTTLMYRRAVRTLQTQPLLVRITAAAVVAVLLIDLVALGAGGRSSNASNRTATGGRKSTVLASGGAGGTTGDAASGGAAGDAAGTAGNGGGGVVGGDSSILGGGGAGESCPSLPLGDSDKGVTADKIKVVFPWFDISQYTSVSGTSTDEPVEAGGDAINAYVNWVNTHMCLGGRSIDAQVESFNPLNETEMQELCRRWTEDDQAFAVVDSSAWHSYHQKCIAKDHRTPLVTSLGLTEQWPQDASPYLWYTAPTTEETVADWVSWMVESGQLTSSNKIGVVTGGRDEEKVGRDALEKALQHFGLQATFKEIPGVATDIAQSQVPIGLAISDFKQKGVDRLVMGLTALVFTSWAQQADSQEFWPRYELGDWNSTLVVAESLIATQNARAFTGGAVGPTFMHLGEPSADKGGSMTPAEQLCADIWQQANPSAKPIDRAGVAMRWCDNILMFAEGVRRATLNSNGALTRDNWAEAMATTQNVEGGMTPTYSFASGDFSGPTMTKVVELHINEEDFCLSRGDTDAYCLVEIAPYGEMRRI